jgi:H+/Cl- antiporter ClcA
MDLSRRGSSTVVITDVTTSAFALHSKAQSPSCTTTTTLHHPNHHSTDHCLVDNKWPEQLPAVPQSISHWGQRHALHGSVVVPLVSYSVIGIACGGVAFLYYTILETALHVVWKSIPQYIASWWNPDEAAALSNGAVSSSLWIIPIGVLLTTALMAAALIYFGEPYDLATTVTWIHVRGAVPWTVAPAMACISLCSIVAGASLGPEAPLVSMCAAVAGGLSRRFLLPFASSSSCAMKEDTEQSLRLLRHHSVLGMSCATAAFFSCPLGGSLFALEVLSARFSSSSGSSDGVPQQQQTIEYIQEFGLSAIATGTVALMVFRWLARLPIGPIWDLTLYSSTWSYTTKLTSTSPQHALCGLLLGAIGAAVACGYALLRNHVKTLFHSLVPNDKNNESTVVASRALLGAIGIATLGLLVPYTLFWGEFEFQTIATLRPASELPHLFDSSSVIGLELYDVRTATAAGTALVVGLAKFLAIAISLAGGYRGGFIFPLFSGAAAIGRAIHLILPVVTSSDGTSTTCIIPMQLCVLCLAAAVNVAVTRTTIATTLIVTYLSGEPNALPAILVSSLVSYHITSFTPWVFPVPPSAHVDATDSRSSTLSIKGSIGSEDANSGTADELSAFLSDDPLPGTNDSNSDHRNGSNGW